MTERLSELKKELARLDELLSLARTKASKSLLRKRINKVLLKIGVYV